MNVPRTHLVKPPDTSKLLGSRTNRAEAALAAGDPIVAHLRMLSDHIGPRPAGSGEAVEARRYVERTIRTLGGSPDVHPFPMVIPRYQQCTLVTDTGRVIPCLPALGSPATLGVVRGIPTPSRDVAGGEAQAGHEPGMLLCPIGPNPTSAYTRLAAERKAAGVILYHPDVPDLYSEVLPRRDDGVPCVTVRRTDAEWLVHERPAVRLNVARTPVKILCTNIVVELGEVGRPLLVVAHYDTRPRSPGALCNASGVAILLELLSRLRGWTGPRILLAFLDGEELGAAGSKHCRDVLHVLGTLKRLRGVVYLSEMGLQSLAVLPPSRDGLSPRASVAGQSNLVRIARRCAIEEKIQLCEQTSDPGDWTPIPPGVWPCPTIAFASVPTSVRHTTADLPVFIHPKHLLAAAAALDRLVRAS